MIFFNKTYTDIQSALKKPNKVKRLLLRRHDIKFNLNDHISDFLKLKNLEELEVSVTLNHVKELSADFGKLKGLKKIKFLNIQFKEFPDWMENLTNLEHLVIRGCDIEEIPSNIQKLSKLKYFGLENCELSSIPKELNQLKECRNLRITDANVAKFPIKHLPPNLKVLDIRGPRFAYDKKELKNLNDKLPSVKVLSMLKLD
ncbi:MAG: hypothetical protein MRY83_15240 [Flavobacteriales bacterium]|nr:hypothetical protein [Flavobacteriales bacterium]